MNKVCNHCKKELPLKDFRKRNNTDERANTCKSCCKSLLKEGYKVCSICGNIYPWTNEFFSYHNKHGLDTRCKVCAREITSKWQKENKEKANESTRRYLQTDKGKKANISKVRRYKWKTRRLESTLTNIQWDIIKLHFNNKCAYCGEELQLEQDHFIPASKGGAYTKDNIIPACKHCNCSKSDKDFFKWYPTYNKYNKEREEYIMEFLGYSNQLIAN